MTGTMPPHAIGLTPLETHYPGVLVPRELVAPARLEQPPKNRLLDEEVYETVGDTGTIAADPPMLHFSGFEPGQTITKAVRLITTSSRPQRYHIHAPSTPFFSTRCEKRGSVSAGIAETVMVSFKPADLRYYADSIKVHCAGRNLVVPIHAYPALDDVPIPPAIDFGVCELGTRVERLIEMRSSSRVAFEFRVEVLEAHGEVDVAPLTGIVPPGGEQHICVGYTPDTLTSVHARFRVALSQFHYAPVEVRVSGAARPGEAFRREQERIELRNAALRPQLVRALAEQALEHAGELEETLRLEGRAQGGATDGGGADRGAADGGGAQGEDEVAEAEAEAEAAQLARATGDSPPPRRAAPRGFRDHVRGDAVTAAKTFAARAARLASGEPVELRLPARPEPAAEAQTADGYFIPRDMRSSRATAYLLNQVPGKLKLKDLKTTIAAQKASAAETEAALAARGGGGGGGGERAARRSADAHGGASRSSRTAAAAHGAQAAAAADDGALDLALSSAPRQIKELLFSRELARIAAVEKAKEVQQFKCIGEPLLSEEAATATADARARHAAASARARLEAGLTRVETSLESARPLRLLLDEGASEAAIAAAAAARHAPGLGGALASDVAFAPRFDRYLNEMVERIRSLEQLRQAVLAVVAGRRLRRRVALIDAALTRGAGGVRAAASTAAPPPAVRAALAAAPRGLGGGAIGSEIYPLAGADELAGASFGAAPALAPFDAIRLLPLRVPRAHELSGYRHFSVTDDAPAGAYPPLVGARPLRTGAADEAGAPLAVGVAARPAPTPMPASVQPTDAVWGRGRFAATEAAKAERIRSLARGAAARLAADTAKRDAPKSRKAAQQAAEAEAAALMLATKPLDDEVAAVLAADAAPTADAPAPPAGGAAARASSPQLAAASAIDPLLALPPRPLAYARPPRLNELEPAYVLQPVALGRARFVETEMVGQGSARALAAEALLTDGWAQPLTRWAEASPWLLPELLTGPLVADLEVTSARARLPPRRGRACSDIQTPLRSLDMATRVTRVASHRRSHTAIQTHGHKLASNAARHTEPSRPRAHSPARPSVRPPARPSARPPARPPARARSPCRVRPRSPPSPARSRTPPRRSRRARPPSCCSRRL
jgi:hypothetical protein